MRKYWLWIVLAMGVLLAACGQTTPAAPASTPTTANTTAPAATATPELAVPVAANPTRDPNDKTMACKIEASIPTPDPTEVELFPPAGPDDWTLGKESALLTITEYSDFQ